MHLIAPAPLHSCGKCLKMDPASFGTLADSSSLLPDPVGLRRQLKEEGYLFIRGLFEPALILAARASLMCKLDQRGFLEPGTDPLQGVLRSETDLSFLPEIARQDATVQRIVFGPEMRAFYEGLLGGPIRHFDYIWLRAMGFGKGTKPHCDLVYMGRGTHRLYTAWIPYGNVSYELGGLMVLEKSHQQADRIQKYLHSDVDTTCSNRFPKTSGKTFDGTLTNNPVSLQEKFGGRWLTEEYLMGDFLTFRMDLIHASTDNSTQRVRLSTDTRYQRADEPIDERWVGEFPPGHGSESKQERIC